MPGLSADRQRPLAHVLSRSTDSADVMATGTMFLPASNSGMSNRADSRQQALISAPVQSASTGLADQAAHQGADVQHNGRAPDFVAQRLAELALAAARR